MTVSAPGDEPPAPEELAFRVSAFRYESRASQAVKRLKYSRATGLVEFMAEKLLEVACGRDLTLGRVVVPVPIHWTRRCLRGFNQSELLCGKFPKGTVHKELLTRVRATRPQVGLSLAERQSNLAGAFTASPAAKGLKILLVDDVVTSGHTACECAKALLSAGAKEVGVVSFAGEGWRQPPS